MAKARTCSGRVQLRREADKNLIVLKEELINPQVVDLAVKFHGILSKSSSKYTNNAIVDLIPETTITISRFDALRLTVTYNQTSMKALEKLCIIEKPLTKKIFNASEF